MNLSRRLARTFAAAHPEEAASSLDQRPGEEVAAVLGAVSPATAAGVLRRMTGGPARRALEAMKPGDGADVLVELPVDVAASLLRACPENTRDALVDAMDPGLAGDVRTLINYPPGTAGSLMDPRALALSRDLTVEEARETVIRESEHALYNVYLVDRDGVLVGVLNLQELLGAHRRDRLHTIARLAAHRLPALADRHSILGHPGWRSVYSLPVVGEDGRFLGAIRYRTLRRLERQLQGLDQDPGTITAGALGDLFRTGIVGVFGALSGAAPPRGSIPDHLGSIQDDHAHKEADDGRTSEA